MNRPELEPTFARTAEIYLGHPDHPIVSGSLRLDGTSIATAAVPDGATHVDFDCELSEGSHTLPGVFMDGAGNEVGAYYAIVISR